MTSFPIRRNRSLASLTWTDVESQIDSRTVVLLPVGAIEAHGPHLPLDTDVIIAQSVAEGAADRFAAMGRDAWIAPAIAYGVSFVGAGFAGTVPVDQDAMTAYSTWVVRGLSGLANNDVILVTAHLEPAHFATLESVAAASTAETGRLIHLVDHRASPWAERLGSEFTGGSRHAGSYETSIVLAAQRGSVREEILPTLEPVWIDLPARLRAGAQTFAEAGATMAYLGNPARSTEEEGLALLDELAAIVVESYLEARAELDRQCS